MTSVTSEGVTYTWFQEGWEYHREHALSDEELDALGHEGWELVTVTANGTYVFKRPWIDPESKIWLGDF